MLKTAPKFHEIAKRVIEITSDSVLVAHNAQFDYRILQLEFKRLGFDFSMKSICTVILSQELLPEQEFINLEDYLEVLEFQLRIDIVLVEMHLQLLSYLKFF